MSSSSEPSGQIVLWNKHADFVDFAKTVTDQIQLFLSNVRGLDAYLIAMSANSAIMTSLCATDHWSKGTTFDGSASIDSVLGPAELNFRSSLSEMEALLVSYLAKIRAAKEASENNRSF